MTSPALQEVIALLAAPAAGNPAQYLFERAIAEAGLDWRFLTFEVPPERLAEALAGIAALGLRGGLLGGGLPAAALPLVASTSPAATFSGAVNLVTRDEAGGLAGHMTAGRGIIEALRGHIEPAGSQAVVLGAGPVGRAAALELTLAGAAHLAIGDPDPARADALVESLTGLATATAARIEWTAALELPADAAIVVHALDPAAGAVRCGGLRADLVLVESGLAARPTALAVQAAAAGACVVDGIEVHATRTAIDFHALTGLEADTDMLREALDEFLSA
jgi:shikimate dehydrogenase